MTAPASRDSAARPDDEDECVCLSYGPNFCDYGGDHDEPLLAALSGPADPTEDTNSG